MQVEWQRVIREVEDFLFPRLSLSIRERSFYYYMLRHTRVVGLEVGIFAIDPLARALDIANSSAREALRSLHDKRCIKIEERNQRGHIVRVLLPEEIANIVPMDEFSEPIDIEAIDFFSDRRFIDSLLLREEHRCFYCLRAVQKETCVLDHVIPQVHGGNNSYRNIVVSCHECNSQKGGQFGEDYMRMLYRRGMLSQTELQERLAMLEDLKAGHLVPLVS